MSGFHAAKTTTSYDPEAAFRVDVNHFDWHPISCCLLIILLAANCQEVFGLDVAVAGCLTISALPQSDR